MPHLRHSKHLFVSRQGVLPWICIRFRAQLPQPSDRATTQQVIRVCNDLYGYSSLSTYDLFHCYYCPLLDCFLCFTWRSLRKDYMRSASWPQFYPPSPRTSPTLLPLIWWRHVFAQTALNVARGQHIASYCTLFEPRGPHLGLDALDTLSKPLFQTYAPPLQTTHSQC